MEYQYASNGKGNLGVALGAIGSGLALMNNGGFGGFGLFGNNNNNYHCTEGGHFITKDELMSAQVIAKKDQEIAILKSENFTNEKLADVYERITSRILADERHQADWNAAQAVFNATNNGAIGNLQHQINELNQMTRTVIPIEKVCPLPMARYNTWEAPLVTDTTTTPVANA